MAEEQEEDKRAKKAIAVTTALVDKTGIKGCCVECNKEGPYGSKHAGCGGYFTNDLPPTKIELSIDPKKVVVTDKFENDIAGCRAKRPKGSHSLWNL